MRKVKGSAGFRARAKFLGRCVPIAARLRASVFSISSAAAGFATKHKTGKHCLISRGPTGLILLSVSRSALCTVMPYTRPDYVCIERAIPFRIAKIPSPFPVAFMSHNLAKL